jgi:D-alanine-D-alanine ligase
MNILLIAGGWSTEREVSLAGAENIERALRGLGHEVTRYDPHHSLRKLPDAAAGRDFAFINLHGSPGEDGLIQAMLEQVGCPYQGAGPAASCLALNKAASKAMFVRAGLATAPWKLLNALPPRDWQPDVAYPLFIKANTGGSSLHMEKVDAPEALWPALERLFALDSSYLVESAVTGMEITCGVLGELTDGVETPVALPPILIQPRLGTMFDYRSKYEPGGATELCPAPISPALTAEVRRMAVAAHRALGISGYSRADFIVPDDERPVLLEVNTLPGMTATSLLPQEAAAVGMTFADLVARLIELGLARKR